MMDLFGLDISTDTILLAAIVAGLFGVFDRIWALLLDIWEWLIPFHIVKEFEAGVVLRWGHYNRTIGPGLKWFWPCGVEEILTDTVVRRVAYGKVQSCDSKDGTPINISPIIVFYVGNIKRWLLEVDDAEDALLDITYGIVEENVTRTDARDINSDDFKYDILTEVKEEGTAWGARVQEVKFSDRSKTKALRLWTGSGHSAIVDEED